MLTPENIQNQQFHVRFRGFDVDEVDAFLEKVAEHYLLLSQENEKMAAELDSLKGQQAQSQSEEETFKNAIISAQTIADEMKKKASAEAEATISAAKKQATDIVDEANSWVNKLEEQINGLEGEKERIKEELRSFLLQQMDNLENERLGQPSPPPVAASEAEPEPVAEEPEDLDALLATSQEPEQESTAASNPEDRAVAGTEIPEFEALDDDLADLYEKIEIPDDLSEDLRLEDPNAFPAEQLDGQPEQQAAEQLTSTAPEEPPPTIPDLDDDMLFSLEDPLDEPAGPAVVVEPLEEKKE